MPFGAYNGFAVLAVFVVSRIVRRAGQRWTPAINFTAAAAGRISLVWIGEPR